MIHITDALPFHAIYPLIQKLIFLQYCLGVTIEGAGTMCIEASVGLKGENNKIDTKVIQTLINLNRHRKTVSLFSNLFNFNLWRKKLSRPLTVDGLYGRNTEHAIMDYQQFVMGSIPPSGIISPLSSTLSDLQRDLDSELTLDKLLAIMTFGKRSIITSYLPLLKEQLPAYNISTPLRVAHFLAQIGHESLSFKHTEEIASGSAYEGRLDLGNTEPGDGRRFKGRGLIQLTGRANYTAYSNYKGINFLELGNEQRIANEPQLALDVSLWFWDKNNLNAKADQDDVRGITRRINGGFNGLKDRESYLNRAKCLLQNGTR